MTEYENKKIKELITNCIPQYRVNSPEEYESICNELSYSGNYELQSGAYKYAIISENADFVLKIPLSGRETDYGFQSFEDNCFYEAEMYKKIKDLGFDCFFAQTIYYDTIDEVPVYTQEKVITYYDANISNPFRGRGKKFRQLKRWIKENYEYGLSDDSIFDLPKQWWQAALKYYGLTKVKAFINYIQSNEDFIYDIWCDLHWENFGFRESDGSPCILDFSTASDT